MNLEPQSNFINKGQMYEFFDKYKKITIAPGAFYVSNQKVILSTLLGSCVAACLYDPVNQIMGMNHFLLSSRQRKDQIIIPEENGKYGITAMQMLINQMLQRGAKRGNLKAKIFGGANVLHTSQYFSVGKTNSLFAQEFLRHENIPVISSDLEGDVGRVIYFMPDDFSVRVRKVKKTLQNNTTNIYKTDSRSFI
ncbi:MAG: chemotaxis protein CheD [bacterium]|jgi:chemotaxis protein CheD